MEKLSVCLKCEATHVVWWILFSKWATDLPMHVVNTVNNVWPSSRELVGVGGPHEQKNPNSFFFVGKVIESKADF